MRFRLRCHWLQAVEDDLHEGHGLTGDEEPPFGLAVIYPRHKRNGIIVGFEPLRGFYESALEPPFRAQSRRDA
jgi:hypothetical protein